MSLEEIKEAIRQLSPSELAEFTAWFEEFQADSWDRQIAEDVEAGRFDNQRQQTWEQNVAGQCRPLQAAVSIQMQGVI